MTRIPEDPQSLSWWMDTRRGELSITLETVAERAGVSAETLRLAAQGRKMRPVTKGGIERALLWETGSVDRIRSGLPPVKRETVAAARSPEHEDASSLAVLSDEEIFGAAAAIEKVDGPDAADAFVGRAYAAKRARQHT